MPFNPTKATVYEPGVQRINPTSPAEVSSLYNPLSLDWIQILGEGGAVLVKVASTGVVTQNPVSHTSKALYAPYYTRLKSTATLAQIFADVWSQDNADQDIMQIKTQGGSGIYHLDHLGVAYFGS
jgi:hypothetical protein